VLLGPASYVSDGEVIQLTLYTNISASAQGESTLTSEFQVICIPARHGLALHWPGNLRDERSYKKLLTSFELKSLLCNYS